MWVIYLEMGVAFALLILIIWWTLPAKRTGNTGNTDNPGKQDESAKK